MARDLEKKRLADAARYARTKDVFAKRSAEWRKNNKRRRGPFIAADGQIAKTPSVTIEQLRTVLSYNAEVGHTVRIASQRGRGCRPGGRPGYVNNCGYRVIHVFGCDIVEHRAVWALCNGAYPPADMVVDHINGNRSDNRIENLRLATKQQNLCNVRLRTGKKLPKGVIIRRARGGVERFRAVVTLHGKTEYIGTYDTLDEAVAARVSAADFLHGKFSNHGTHGVKVEYQPTINKEGV